MDKVAISEWILGVRPTYTGLIVNPCVPSNWSSFKITRVFRGVKYHINVSQTGKNNKLTIIVNGNPIEGNIIPFPETSIKEIHVEVKIE